ncbi:MAG TPA: radical SAM protein [Fibrobacteraceae bacterium]|nr:radical SAM protein [Fibrobacteraceae bacterium]
MNQNQELHPCFSQKAQHTHGRVHLPVAPRCNIQCNYCNRKYDCANENRPGVTSAVLSPNKAMDYLRRSVAHDPRISVAAIAGPGDAFANPAETLETLRLMRKEFPEMIGCLSTNGLELAPHIQELHGLGVNYVTVTVNAVDPVILAEVYAWVRFNKKTYRGLAAAQMMLERQMEAIEALKAMDFTVKINTVVLPGINDHHIPELARQLSTLHIDRMNLIPVGKNENEFFDHVPEPTLELMDQLRQAVSQYVPLMTHCKRCRSDAAGLLGQEDPRYQQILLEVNAPFKEKPRVAVATQEGVFVNQHLGEAERLLVFEPFEDGYRLLEERTAPPSGLGDMRWDIMASTLHDCGVLLVSGIGGKPLEILGKSELKVVEVNGFIEDHLATIAGGKLPAAKQDRSMFKCGSECGGDGTGCGA